MENLKLWSRYTNIKDTGFVKLDGELAEYLDFLHFLACLMDCSINYMCCDFAIPKSRERGIALQVAFVKNNNKVTVIFLYEFLKLKKIYFTSINSGVPSCFEGENALLEFKKWIEWWL